ncbi:hypothetical protein SAMN04487977_1061, partial [Treponema bryantii]
MKKYISLIIISFIFVTLSYSKSLIKTNGNITGSLKNDEDHPNYSLEITVDNDNACKKESDFCLVQAGEKLNIKYSSACVKGHPEGPHAPSGSSEDHTILKIRDSNKSISYSNPITVKENEVYTIELYHEATSTWNPKYESTLIFSVRIYGVNKDIDIVSADKITNFKGYLCDFHDNKYNYGLSIYCENATQKFSERPVWYVKKGEPVTIVYNSYSDGNSSSGYNSSTGESGSGGYSDYTYLKRNGTTLGKLPTKIEEDMIFELFFVRTSWGTAAGNVHEETLQTKVIIKVDDTPPTMPSSITGLSEGWTAENVTLTANGSTDDKSGFSHYEYKVGEQGEWTRGSEYNSNVQEHQILNTTVYFRAVDNVGNASEAVAVQVKIDRCSPVISADKEARKWTNESITVTASDENSGIPEKAGLTVDNVLYDGKSYTITETGKHTVTAKDAAGNSTTKQYWIDKEAPVINLNGYIADTWTNKDVTIKVTDNHSDIKSVTKNQEAVSNYTEFKIESTGQYEITAKDKVDNENKVTVKIDKVVPSVSELTFSGFGYESKGEAEYVNAFDVKYNVTENDSGIKENKNILYLNGSIVNESTDKNVIYREKQNLAKVQRKENDKTFEYSVKVTDNAGNRSVEKKARLTIPRTIILKTVEKEDENQGLRKSCIKDGYTINGILINKIDFGLYKTIRLKRTFLADKEEGQNRKEFCYEEYKARFDGSVREEEIKENWEKASQTVITKADVRKVTIGGEEYWYYEDKIKTESGLGHRGIRYQAEWDWKALGVTEKGEYVTIDKTANTPGRVKIRLQGTDVNGEGIRYVVLDGEGKRIEEESDADFTVPVSGVIRLAVKVEDADFDDYSIEATELVKAVFMKGSEQSEETLTVAMEGAGAEGYIVKTNENGNLKSQFRPGNTSAGGWHEFANPEVKLYYNKPFNMKITMTEGCNGASGAYKDVTESGVIMLMAGTPKLGGFKLLVGEEAGYNKDGITSRPHQEIGLGIEFSEEGENPDKIEWNYGDGGQSEGDSVKHKYDQSPERKGNTSEYELTIRVVSGQDEKRASVNVHIIDTQYGALLGDEEWIGMHPVLGRIQVPENVTLSVSDNRNDKENPTVILGYGSALEER